MEIPDIFLIINHVNLQVVFAAFLACAAAAPTLLVGHETPVVAVHAAPVVHTVPVVGSKTTITKSSQVVNHGSVHAVHTPVVHVKSAVVSAPVVHSVHAVHAAPVVHAVAPVVHAPVVAPVVIKSAPSAVSHSSSVVSHSAVKAIPVVALH